MGLPGIAHPEKRTMAKLILSLDGKVLREIPLDQPRMTIGRKAHNPIHIDNLAISGEHACIVQNGQSYSLEDLGSTNGTLVNGQPFKKGLLREGDLIELGKYRLKFFGDQMGASVGMATGINTTLNGVKTQAVLQILSGSQAGKLLELTKDLSTLGKPGIQVATIARRPEGYFVAQIEGAQAALLNTQPLAAQAQRLEDHDILELAGVKMEFYFKA